MLLKKYIKNANTLEDKARDRRLNVSYKMGGDAIQIIISKHDSVRRLYILVTDKIILDKPKYIEKNGDKLILVNDPYMMRCALKEIQNFK